MDYSIFQLKTLWNKEHNSYKTQEVGSGIHRFVRYVLECPEIFNLNEGELATTHEKRKNEYIYEKKTKDRRQCDFVIYINSEIIIPIEAEQYTNIQQGVDQLSQYQSDLEKKYGILTDGYTWRFYNNNIYRTFTIDQILSETSYFLVFWKEYVKPEYYYLSYFEETGQMSLFERGSLLVEDNRELFFNDITKLIRIFRNKLRVEGYFNGLDKKEAEKKATEITYAYIIQFILYKTLTDNKFENFDSDYKTRIKSIHNAIKNHSYTEVLGVIDGISAQISKNIYRPFTREQEYIQDKLFKLIHKAKNELSDVSPWLDIIVFIKKYDFQNIQNEIFGHIYENYLKELYTDEKKGQYFTDPAVVNFMLQQIGYTAKEIREKIKQGKMDKLSLVDPACGSGTFLYNATGEIVKSFSNITNESSKQIENIITNNIFGLDIEEFPLYLAEMNVLMRMLHLIMGEKYNNPLEKKINVFITKDSISEFIGSGLENIGTDTYTQAGQLSFIDKLIQPEYSSYMRDEEDLAEMKESMLLFPRRRFDYVIANPPYISYNECSKRGVLIFNLIKEGRVKLNNIYGVNLHSVPNKPKRYRPNPNLYAFFIALGLTLLKADGKLCYIIPQTSLINADFDVLRYHLSTLTTIEKIITFEGKMFLGRGLQQTKAIPTSSLIIVASRIIPTIDHEIEIVNYKGTDEDIEKVFSNIDHGIKTRVRRILQTDLQLNIDNWNFIKLDKIHLDFIKNYIENSDDFSSYYQHTLAKHTFNNTFVFDGGYSIDERKLLKSPSAKHTTNYECPKLEDRYWTIHNNCGFWPNIRDDKTNRMFIALRQGNQGHSFLDARYKIIWSYNATDRFYYTDKDVIWARNKMLGIASNDRPEILYLFSLLNSKVTKCILDNFVKIAQEDTRTILVSLQIVKTQLRVPKITTNNQQIKDAIIQQVEKLLEYENHSLSEFVDFSDVLLQKFNDVKVQGNHLILTHDGKRIELKISKDSELIGNIITGKYVRQLQFEENEIDLSELRNLDVMDVEKQRAVKNHIDDLVFALYFNIRLTNADLQNPDNVTKLCSKSEYYDLCRSSC